MSKIMSEMPHRKIFLFFIPIICLFFLVGCSADDEPIHGRSDSASDSSFDVSDSSEVSSEDDNLSKDFFGTFYNPMGVKCTVIENTIVTPYENYHFELNGSSIEFDAIGTVPEYIGEIVEFTDGYEIVCNGTSLFTLYENNSDAAHSAQKGYDIADFSALILGSWTNEVLDNIITFNDNSTFILNGSAGSYELNGRCLEQEDMSFVIDFPNFNTMNIYPGATNEYYTYTRTDIIQVPAQTEKAIGGLTTLDNTVWLSDNNIILAFYNGHISYRGYTLPYTLQQDGTFIIDNSLLEIIKVSYKDFSFDLPSIFAFENGVFKGELYSDGRLALTSLDNEGETIFFSQYTGENQSSVAGIWLADCSDTYSFTAYEITIFTEDNLQLTQLNDTIQSWKITDEGLQLGNVNPPYPYTVSNDRLCIIWAPVDIEWGAMTRIKTSDVFTMISEIAE